MDAIHISEILLAVFFGLVNVGCVTEEKVHCWTDYDCADGGDILAHECTVKECKCRHGHLGDNEKNCKPPNFCDGFTHNCTVSDSICYQDNECKCVRGLAIFDKDGKLKKCESFEKCDSEEDCDPHSRCEAGRCVCRLGTIRSKSSMREYCKTFNYCKKDEECPKITGYCDMETMKCACKEGKGMASDLGRIHRCGPDYFTIFILTFCVYFFVFVIMLSIIWLYLLKRHREEEEED